MVLVSHRWLSNARDVTEINWSLRFKIFLCNWASL